jgi:cysteine synthase
MNRIEITTARTLRTAVANAKLIMVQPRLGCSEMWVKLGKKEAKLFVKGITNDMTPDDLGTGTGTFGDIDLDTGTVYIG